MKFKIKDSNWLFCSDPELSAQGLSITEENLLEAKLAKSASTSNVLEMLLYRGSISWSENAVKENSPLRGHHQCSSSIIITHKPLACAISLMSKIAYFLCVLCFAGTLCLLSIGTCGLQYFLKWFESPEPFLCAHIISGALLCQPWKKWKETQFRNS